MENGKTLDLGRCSLHREDQRGALDDSGAAMPGSRLGHDAMSTAQQLLKQVEQARQHAAEQPGRGSVSSSDSDSDGSSSSSSSSAAGADGAEPSEPGPGRRAGSPSMQGPRAGPTRLRRRGGVVAVPRRRPPPPPPPPPEDSSSGEELMPGSIAFRLRRRGGLAVPPPPPPLSDGSSDAETDTDGSSDDGDPSSPPPPPPPPPTRSRKKCPAAAAAPGLSNFRRGGLATRAGPQPGTAIRTDSGESSPMASLSSVGAQSSRSDASEISAHLSAADGTRSGTGLAAAVVSPDRRSVESSQPGRRPTQAMGTGVRGQRVESSASASPEGAGSQLPAALDGMRERREARRQRMRSLVPPPPAPQGAPPASAPHRGPGDIALGSVQGSVQGIVQGSVDQLGSSTTATSDMGSNGLSGQTIGSESASEYMLKLKERREARRERQRVVGSHDYFPQSEASQPRLPPGTELSPALVGSQPNNLLVSHTFAPVHESQRSSDSDWPSQDPVEAAPVHRNVDGDGNEMRIAMGAALRYGEAQELGVQASTTVQSSDVDFRDGNDVATANTLPADGDTASGELGGEGRFQAQAKVQTPDDAQQKLLHQNGTKMASRGAPQANAELQVDFRGERAEGPASATAVSRGGLLDQGPAGHVDFGRAAVAECIDHNLIALESAHQVQQPISGGPNETASTTPALVSPAETAAATIRDELSNDGSRSPVLGADSNPDNGCSPIAKEVHALQQQLSVAQVALKSLLEEPERLKSNASGRVQRIHEDTVAILAQAVDEIADIERKEAMQIVELRRLADLRELEASEKVADIEADGKQKIASMGAQLQQLSEGKAMDAQRAFEQRLSQAKDGLNNRRTDVEKRVEQAKAAIEQAQQEQQQIKDGASKRVSEIRGEMAVIRRDAVAKIARSERALTQRVADAERSAKQQLVQASRTAEERAASQAEAKLAEAQALFNAKVGETQRQARFDIESVKKEVEAQKEAARTEMTQVRAQMEVQIVEAEKRETDRIADAQRAADSKVQTAVAEIRKEAESRIVDAERRELKRIAETQRLAELRVQEASHNAEQHAIGDSAEKLQQVKEGFEKQFQEQHDQVEQEVSAARAEAVEKAGNLRIDMQRLRSQMEERITEARAAEASRVADAEKMANDRVQEALSRSRAQTEERVKAAEAREMKRCEEVQKAADIKIAEAKKISEKKIAELKKKAEDKIKEIAQDLKSALSEDKVDREQRIMDILDGVSLLEKVPTNKKKIIGKAMDIKTFHAGEAIITEGDAGDAFYVIENGMVKVCRLAHCSDDVSQCVGLRYPVACR